MDSADQVTPLVENINKRVNSVLLAGGDDKELLISLYNFMGDFMKVMNESTEQKFGWYCQRYDGFERYARLLEQIAQGISNGTISVPK